MEERPVYLIPKLSRCAMVLCASIAAVGCSSNDGVAEEFEYPPGRTTLVADSAHFIPDSGFIPDSATAVEFAEAVLRPIYGKALVLRQRPFTATLTNGVWTVTGSIPPSHVGGVALVQLSRQDARVLRVQHSQ